MIISCTDSYFPLIFTTKIVGTSLVSSHVLSTICLLMQLIILSILHEAAAVYVIISFPPLLKLALSNDEYYQFTGECFCVFGC